MSSPGLQSGASISSTDVDPDPNIPNQYGPRPNICNRCWSWDNDPFLPPQLFALEPQSIPTDGSLKTILATDVRAPLISIISWAPLSSDAKAPTDSSDRRRGRSNYLQPTPRIPKILPINTRAFKPGAVAPLWPYQILTPGLPPTRSSGSLAIYTLEIFLACLFIVAWLAHPFYVKITVTRCSYPLCACTPINS